MHPLPRMSFQSQRLRPQSPSTSLRKKHGKIVRKKKNKPTEIREGAVTRSNQASLTKGNVSNYPEHWDSIFACLGNMGQGQNCSLHIEKAGTGLDQALPGHTAQTSTHCCPDLVHVRLLVGPILIWLLHSRPPCTLAEDQLAWAGTPHNTGPPKLPRSLLSTQRLPDSLGEFMPALGLKEAGAGGWDRVMSRETDDNRQTDGTGARGRCASNAHPRPSFRARQSGTQNGFPGERWSRLEIH